VIGLKAAEDFVLVFAVLFVLIALAVLSPEVGAPSGELIILALIILTVFLPLNSIRRPEDMVERERRQRVGKELEEPEHLKP
jgi:hypothetical protein